MLVLIVVPFESSQTHTWTGKGHGNPKLKNTIYASGHHGLMHACRDFAVDFVRASGQLHFFVASPGLALGAKQDDTKLSAGKAGRGAVR